MSSKSVMIFVRALLLEEGGGRGLDLVPLRIGFVRFVKDLEEQGRIVRWRYDRFANVIEVLAWTLRQAAVGRNKTRSLTLPMKVKRELVRPVCRGSP